MEPPASWSSEQGPVLIAANVPWTEFWFASADGLRVACTQWKSEGPLRGIVQIAHGMGEHIGRYRRLIEALVSSGLTVYGNDHRHGRTAVSSKDLGDFGEGGFDLLVADMFRVSGIAEEENPGKPLILFGHSMGSPATSVTNQHVHTSQTLAAPESQN